MSAPGIMEIYLVRHGETGWNRVQRLQGQPPTAPMSAAGRGPSPWHVAP